MDGLGAVKQTIFLKKLGLSRRTEPNNERNTSVTVKAEDTKGKTYDNIICRLTSTVSWAESLLFFIIKYPQLSVYKIIKNQIYQQ